MSATLDECRAAEKFREEIYSRHAAGCCWHVVLDDGNIETHLVEYTIAHDVPSCPDSSPKDCANIGPLILKMSPTQRRKLSKGGYEGK